MSAGGPQAGSTDFFDAWLSASPVLAIFRSLDPDEAVSRAQAAWRSGVPLVEVPVQDESSWTTFAAVRDAAEGRPVGVGTVLTQHQVERAAAEHAAFCVSPGLDAKITRACASRAMPHLPGVATPSEISAALNLGYTWLKAFPASVLGPEWIRAMLGPFPTVRLVCTGGMTLNTWPDYQAAGARAVAIGGGWARQ